MLCYACHKVVEATDPGRGVGKTRQTPKHFTRVGFEAVEYPVYAWQVSPSSRVRVHKAIAWQESHITIHISAKARLFSCVVITYGPCIRRPRFYGLARYSALYICCCRGSNALPSMQRLLRHPDDDILLPYLLLNLHSTVSNL